MKRLLFGNGPITSRLVLDGWHWQFEFKPQDLWVGAFWKTSGHCVDLWICFLPCVPLHVSWWYCDPEQSGQSRSVDRCVTALLLTDFEDVELVESAAKKWSQAQRDQAFDWAAREHLHASDNDDVDRLPCPPHVAKLRESLPPKNWTTG